MMLFTVPRLEMALEFQWWRTDCNVMKPGKKNKRILCFKIETFQRYTDKWGETLKDTMYEYSLL